MVELGRELLAWFSLTVNCLSTCNWNSGLVESRGGHGVSVHFSESEIGAQRRNCFVLGLSDAWGPDWGLNEFFAHGPKAGEGLCHLKAPVLDPANCGHFLPLTLGA